METVVLAPNLYQLRMEVGHAYLWRDPGALTLIDTGSPGSGEAIVEAIERLGWDPGELRTVVLTHFHADHAGGAAELAGRDGVTVVAHRLEAPVIRGEATGPEPDMDGAPEWERALYDGVPHPPTAPPAPVHREVGDGDELDIAGGAVVVEAPGHTDGSIALHLPGPGVLFTGDAAAGANGGVIPGVFHADRTRATESFRRLAGLEVETVCFGHGDPLLGGAGVALRRAADALG
ncbi:MBL fold metallo-hydrolase [Streptomyces calidiresistens]|uniref:MBL fold metallo-hydrolase n=1 Tax=Streptomyces calidiresistens TaxID=1485586 RepID=A0A7W3XYT2_9ACTN|nr:MBL fold metallo-hydrolase [Streptomyces calidiresistens]MBB0232146.1 MBL fold metallo-hydrolase [Streptomyces calidiresistens]